MGKSYNNYMCKKDFHPASRDNIKRVWMRQQQLEHEKKKQEEMMDQYKKEQDMHETRVLMGDSKAKLGLSFMYDAPPGLQKKKEEDEDNIEYKFEWQRNAPREKWMKDDKQTLNDQPFGVCVRNVRCIKCHQWGHINTDRECPLYHKTSSFDPSVSVLNPSAIAGDMQSSSGLKLKPRIMNHHFEARDTKHQIIKDEEEDEPEVAFLQNLSDKQKVKLLRRLNRMDKKEKKNKKNKDKKKKKSKRRSSSDTTSELESEGEKSTKKRQKKHQQKDRKRWKTRESSESVSTDDESLAKRQKRHCNDLHKNLNPRSEKKHERERRSPSPRHNRKEKYGRHDSHSERRHDRNHSDCRKRH